MVGWFNRRLRRDREDGAALVEFAVVLPLFIILIFGIMESGWAFAQQVEVRNAAREGARLAVVDFGTSAEIIAETCSRAVLSADRASVYLDHNNQGTSDESAIVTVAQNYKMLTGLTGILGMFDGITITSTAEMRVERDGVGWATVAGANPGADAGACPP